MKNKIIELIDALREELAPNAYIKISNAVQSFSDDKPELLPFEYPVKEGYEVVTRDGRKAEQLTRFDGVSGNSPLCGVIDKVIEFWTENGKFLSSGEKSNADLFLRRVEKKVWVVEGKDHAGDFFQSICSSLKDAKNWACTDEIIYEATLKPVV